MENLLKEINAVLGVSGSFVCLSDSSIAAKAVPENLDAAHLETAARVATQTINALETSGHRITDADLSYAQGRLILRNLRGGILVILCQRNINVALLNLTANVVAKKLTAELKPPKPAEAAAPKATTPAPASAAPAKIPEHFITLPPLLDELEQEVTRLSKEAGAYRLSLHVIGSLAIWIACPHCRGFLVPPEKRQIELVARSAQSNALTILFEKEGYASNARFNAFYGNRRLNFANPQRDINIEIFLDAVELYHRLDVLDSMSFEGITLPETDLLLTRLQLVEIGDSEIREVCALLREHDLSVGAEREKLDAAQITNLCADDWGWFKTISMNLDRVVSFAAASLTPADRAIVSERAQRLKQSIDSAPKSLRWQTRARLGEAVKWYETPPVFSSRPRPDMALG
jgi:predicted regulator of Ras-like GTPase activity (Roadblock/LC7/MglB family)